MAIEKHIGDWWRTLLNNSMKQAGEENSIVLAKQNYQNGEIPKISVIVDEAGANVHRNTPIKQNLE